MIDLYSGPSPFEVFTRMSNELKTFNFGHGSPDSHPPQFIKDSLQKAMDDPQNYHQYCRPMGQADYAQEVANEFSESFGRKLDPQWEVCTSVGATGCIVNTLYAYLKPGDEMVCFEPAFLGYAPLFNVIGINTKWVPFKDNKKEQKFEFDREKFAAAITDKTKLIFINNPHNPCGIHFTKDDLEFMASLARKTNAIILADEVYEKFVFNNKPFIRFAALPDMWERTVSVYSSGKNFSCTGWRVGFSIAPKELTVQLASFQTWNLYCLNTVSAKAIALGMIRAKSEPYDGYPTYYDWVRETFRWRANKVGEIVSNSTLGIKVSNTNLDVQSGRRIL